MVLCNVFMFALLPGLSIDLAAIQQPAPNPKAASAAGSFDPGKARDIGSMEYGSLMPKLDMFC
jgi:hypothetical protein